MSKHEVTIEVAVTHTYEIDLKADAYASFDTVKQALEYDTGRAHEDPVRWMENLGDLDTPEPHIRTRARVHGTTKYDVLLED